MDIIGDESEDVVTALEDGIGEGDE